MESTHAVATLTALAHDSRLAIYRLLVEAGPTGMAAGEIGTSVRIPPATLSFHLKELANAGLLLSRQDGRYIFYSANYEHMNTLLAFLTENCCARDACRTGCAPAKKHTQRTKT